MDPAPQRERLLAIYEEFERQAAAWKKDALCGRAGTSVARTSAAWKIPGFLKLYC